MSDNPSVSPETEKYETSMTPPKMTQNHVDVLDLFTVEPFVKSSVHLSARLAEVLANVKCQSDKQGVWVTTEEIEKLLPYVEGIWIDDADSVMSIMRRWLSGASR